MPRPRRLGWPTTLAACLLAATAGAVTLDQARVAGRGTPAVPPGPDNSAQLMIALATTGKMPGHEVPPELAERVGRRLAPGSPAPDFTLPAIRQPREVTLSAFRGRPLVLVFGSFTCDLFCHQLDDIDRFYRVHGDQCEFLFVNVSEAGHVTPGLEFLLEDREAGPPSLRSQGKRARATLDGRRARVARGVERMNVRLPGVIDIEGAAEDAYDAFPQRMVVVNENGEIAVDLGKGLHAPWILSEAEDWLRAHADHWCGEEKRISRR